MNIHHLIHTYGYWAVLGLILAESFGVPLPGETALIAAATYAGTTHRLSIVALYAVAAAAAVTGDVIGYWIGRTGGWALIRRFGRLVRLDEPKIKVARLLFDEYGGWVVIGGRFVSILRTYSAILAGTSYMKFRRFLLFDLIGGLAWAAVYSFGAYGAGSFISKSSTGFEIGAGCAAFAAVVAVVLVIRHHLGSLKARAEAAYPGSISDWSTTDDDSVGIGSPTDPTAPAGTTDDEPAGVQGPALTPDDDELEPLELAGE